MEFDPACFDCKHLKDKTFGKCKAFPGGIPVDIWDGTKDHLEAYPGDGGTRYDGPERPRS
jgi:hypothetical protein